MDTDPEDDPHSTAIEQLQQFGLSTYAARTFVALAAMESGTARDVSEASEVPRTRVYDATDELHRRGLIDVQHSSPREFHGISAETAARQFGRELEQRVKTLISALEEVQPERSSKPQRGVWTVEGQAAVTERVREFVEDAEEEVVFMTVEELLTDDVVTALSDAAKRNASIELGGISPAVQEEIRDDVPDAEMFESLWIWSDTTAGRLLMVDGERTLVSVLVNGDDADPGEPRTERAIWGAGESNSLVVVLRAIFAWRLEDSDAE